MVDDEYPITDSLLSRHHTEAGQTVEIRIYHGPNENWVLEVVDGYGNSTVWDDLFPTDQEALDEVMRTIREEGMDALVTPPSRSLH